MDIVKGKSQVSEEIPALLVSRGDEYGEAWKLTGIVTGALLDDFVKMATVYPPVIHNWILILSKLLRALRSPKNRDHWVDIAGYAQLIVDDLDNEAKNEVPD